MDERDLKNWRNAGHVARRTLEAMESEIVAGASWHSIIDASERYIKRHGAKPAFPVTLCVNDFAAHFTTDHTMKPPEGWKGDMVLQKGDLVKLDVGVHVKGAIADNAMTVEVGGGRKHTDQIRAAREARDAAIERMHPGTPWHEVGAAAEQASTDAGFEPIRNLCGHELKTFDLHAGTSVPSHACGANNQSFKGEVPLGGVFAIEPFNTTGGSGLVENVPPRNSSNIYRVTGGVDIRKALAKGRLKPLGATMARYIEERYSTLPFAERWAYPLLEKPFPKEGEENRMRKWNALAKKLTSIRFLETYHALRCSDGGSIGQFEHTVLVTEGGPEITTVA